MKKIKKLLAAFTKCLCILLIAHLSSCATSNLTSKKNIAKAWNSLPAISSALAGVYVGDPLTHQTVFEQNGHRYFAPASCNKLLTWYAASKTLPAVLPGFRYIETQDTLRLFFLGNPSTFLPNFHSAALDSFMKQHTATMVLLTLPANEQSYRIGWQLDDMGQKYCPVLSSMPLASNQMRFKVHKQKLQLLSPDLQNAPYTLSPILATQTNTIPNSLLLEKYSIVLKPLQADTMLKLPLNMESFAVELFNAHYPNKNFKLVYTLDTVKNTKLFNYGLRDSLFKQLLQFSDNFLAEQMAWLSARYIGVKPDSKDILDQWAAKYYGQCSDSLCWDDACGLSRYNLMTPATFNTVLDSIFHTYSFAQIKNFLPTGGKSGTLKSWFPNHPMRIYAKTGSFSNTQNLCGYILTESGRILSFTIFANQFVCPPEKIKDDIESFLFYLSSKY